MSDRNRASCRRPTIRTICTWEDKVYVGRFVVPASGANILCTYGCLKEPSNPVPWSRRRTTGLTHREVNAETSYLSTDQGEEAPVV